MARIRVEAQMARLSIDMQPRRMRVDWQRAKMTVSRENPSLEIDMEDLRNNIGLKSIDTLTREMASQSYAQARQGIKDIENNGDYVAKLPHSGNPIAQIARNSMLEVRRMPAAGNVSDPTVPVKSHPGSLSIDWSVHDVSITWDDYQDPVITIDPKPAVNVTLAQEPHIAFKVVEYAYPPESGRTIDEEI